MYHITSPRHIHQCCAHMESNNAVLNGHLLLPIATLGGDDDAAAGRHRLWSATRHSFKGIDAGNGVLSTSCWPTWHRNIGKWKETLKGPDPKACPGCPCHFLRTSRLKFGLKSKGKNEDKTYTNCLKKLRGDLWSMNRSFVVGVFVMERIGHITHTTSTYCGCQRHGLKARSITLASVHFSGETGTSTTP